MSTTGPVTRTLSTPPTRTTISSSRPNACDTTPGRVIAAGREGIDIACGDGVLRIRSLQREGGKAITAADYLNARRDLLAIAG